MTEWPDITTRLRRLKKSALNWDGRFYTMSDGTCCYSWSFLEAADLIEQQAAHIAELAAENIVLREALKPFDERLKVLETVPNAAKYATSTDIDIVHLRNARAALNGDKG